MIHTCYLFVLFLLLEKKFGHDFFKKKNIKKKKSDLPTLIFLDMSLETDIIFFLPYKHVIIFMPHIV